MVRAGKARYIGASPILALDWCDGTPLARRSFALHPRLALEIGVDWGYRRLDTLGGRWPRVPPASYLLDV